jgi:cytochrome P450
MSQRSPAMQAELCPYAEVAARQMLFTDPPDHTRLRGLVSQAFTAKMVERMRPHVETIVEDLLDRAAAAGSMDVVRDFAYPLPATVILDMLGLPQEDRDRFKAWSVEFAAILGNAHLDEDVDRRGQQGTLEAIAHFRVECDRLRGRPADGLFSAMVLAEEDGQRLTVEELVANALFLLAAGHETTTNLIGSSVLALLRHPGEFQRLHEEPGLAAGAVEELLRYDSPIQMTTRIASEDIEVAGRRLPKGTLVGLMIGAANRDPDRFDDPDRLDITRPDNRHLALSRGLHFCLGSSLAKLEGSIAVAAVARRFPGLRLAPEGVQWQPNFAFRGLKTLPVTW